MEYKSDLAFAAESLGHQVGGGNAVAVIVGRHRAHIFLAGGEAFGNIVHEHQLDALVGDSLVGGGGGDGIDRDGDDDVWLLGHHGLEVGDLLLRLEASVGGCDDLDAFGGELRLQRRFLRVRPVIAAVVKHQRRLGVLGLHLRQLVRR